MPDVRVDVRQWLAGVGVNELDIHEQRHTGLALDHVATNELSGNICRTHCQMLISVEGGILKLTVWALSHFGLDDAGAAGCKEDTWIG